MSADPPSVFRPGGISYVQIPCLVPGRAADFYESVFGWHIRRDSEEPAFTDSSGHVIGHFRLGEVDGGEGNIRPYIYVDDIDRTLRSVTDKGGEIASTPLPEGTLRVGMFRDPEGNLVGVWTETARS